MIPPYPYGLSRLLLLQTYNTEEVDILRVPRAIKEDVDLWRSSFPRQKEALRLPYVTSSPNIHDGVAGYHPSSRSAR
jgi:hypothetical protein